MPTSRPRKRKRVKEDPQKTLRIRPQKIQPNLNEKQKNQTLAQTSQSVVWGSVRPLGQIIWRKWIGFFLIPSKNCQKQSFFCWNPLKAYIPIFPEKFIILCVQSKTIACKCYIIWSTNFVKFAIVERVWFWCKWSAGKGSYGAVYKARDIKTSELVAIKVISLSEGVWVPLRIFTFHWFLKFIVWRIFDFYSC